MHSNNKAKSDWFEGLQKIATGVFSWDSKSNQRKGNVLTYVVINI